MPSESFVFLRKKYLTIDSYCAKLTQITIPSSVTSIRNYAFYQCSSLTQISIPSSVISIGWSAFYECSSLTQIIIPSSINSIGNCIFTYCKKLDKISIEFCNEKRIEYIENKFLVFRTNSTGEIFDALVFTKANMNTVTIPSFINTIKGAFH